MEVRNLKAAGKKTKEACEIAGISLNCFYRANKRNKGQTIFSKFI